MCGADGLLQEGVGLHHPLLGGDVGLAEQRGGGDGRGVVGDVLVVGDILLAEVILVLVVVIQSGKIRKVRSGV